MESSPLRRRWRRRRRHNYKTIDFDVIHLNGHCADCCGRAAFWVRVCANETDADERVQLIKMAKRTIYVNYGQI